MEFAILKTIKFGDELPAAPYAKLYEDAEKQEVHYALYPFSIFIKTWNIIRVLWNMYRNKSTFIDKRIDDAYKFGVRSGLRIKIDDFVKQLNLIADKKDTEPGFYKGKDLKKVHHKNHDTGPKTDSQRRLEIAHDILEEFGNEMNRRKFKNRLGKSDKDI